MKTPIEIKHLKKLIKNSIKSCDENIDLLGIEYQDVKLAVFNFGMQHAYENVLKQINLVYKDKNENTLS